MKKHHHACKHTITEEAARELLADKGINRTRTKLDILTTLSKAHGPLSVAEIHERIGSDSCDISTVFRTMTQFTEKELVRELNLGEDFFRYEVVSPEDKHHHHHHVRCRNCGSIKALETCDLTPIEKIVSKLGFSDLKHVLEFSGICAKCH
jgi:Fur family ferric uptake transcriptional regulator